MGLKYMAVAGFILVVTGVVALGATGHFDRSSPVAIQHPAQMLHASCTASGENQTPHVPAHFAQLLELTPAQSAEIDRLAVEACAAMSRIHEGMMDVLTPEQRAKVAELHKGGGHHTVVGEWLRKLHGR
jgi:Spy/CpxP family protein refolding chaperone